MNWTISRTSVTINSFLAARQWYHAPGNSHGVDSDFGKKRKRALNFIELEKPHKKSLILILQPFGIFNPLTE